MRELAQGRSLIPGITNKKLAACAGFVLIILLECACAKVSQPREITIVGPNTPFMWPIYIAKEAGYYEKYGLDVKLVFANHPADIAMLVSGEAQVNANTLQQALELSPKTSSLIMFPSPLNKWLFALVARKEIKSVGDLRGKRIGVTQIGGSTYAYAVRLLAEFGFTPDQVDWVSLGSTARAAALVSGRIDATMLSAPLYFALENDGYKTLANINDYDDIQTPNILLFTKDTVTKNPQLPRLLIKANAEAVKRFYADKDFAIRTYLLYDKQATGGLEKVYETYSKNGAFERIPYIMADSVRYMIENAIDRNTANQMRSFDFHSVIDNKVIDRLVREGFFENLFGSEVRLEEEHKAALAFR